MSARGRILIIGNYPPPMCGWAIQTKLVVEELRRRGHYCEVLKINEGRQLPGSDYVDVQGGFDYLRKVWLYARNGYRLNVHLNGMGRTGYLLALAAVLVGRAVNRPALVTFHGGLPQNNFPRDKGIWRVAFEVLFRLAGEIACDAEPVKREIEKYGVPAEQVRVIATFSAQYLNYSPAALPDEAEQFLRTRQPCIFCYVSFRPEYRLEVLRQAMQLFRAAYPTAGFVWLGFPAKELQAVEEFVNTWSAEERAGLLLLGNLPHDQFLTLLTRTSIFLRTPACDGVCASVLEALVLGVPVVASDNQRRPPGVVTYRDSDPVDMCAKLIYATEHHAELKAGGQASSAEDNIGAMADWLAGEAAVTPTLDVVAVR